jgi:hypothetical protein
MAPWKRYIWTILVLMVPDIAGAQDTEQRYELGGLVTYTFLREIGTRDVGVGTDSGGLGGRLVYRAFPLLDFETEFNFLPGNSATSGNHLQGFFCEDWKALETRRDLPKGSTRLHSFSP